MGGEFAQDGAGSSFAAHGSSIRAECRECFRIGTVVLETETDSSAASRSGMTTVVELGALALLAGWPMAAGSPSLVAICSVCGEGAGFEA